MLEVEIVEHGGLLVLGIYVARAPRVRRRKTLGLG
jgi:hypothetical protein